MSVDEDFSKLAEFFQAHRARLAQHLAEAPPSAVRDKLMDSVGEMQSDLDAVMAGFKQEFQRHEKVAAAAFAKIEAAKKSMEETAKAYQAQLAKKAEAPAKKLEPPLDPTLHARLRDLLLDEYAVIYSQPERFGGDPGSVADRPPPLDAGDWAADADAEMDSIPLIQASLAKEVADTAELSGHARALLAPRQTLREYVENLLHAKLFHDVCNLLAVGMPARETLWWASLCVRQSVGSGRAGKDEAALRATVSWVLEPTPKSRAAALTAGTEAGADSPCGCLSMSAGQPPASLAASQQLVTANSAARHVSRALSLASVGKGPSVVELLSAHFVRLGLGVATEVYSWKRLVSPTGSGEPADADESPDHPTPAEERFKALEALLPKLAAPPQISLLDGHSLGKLLLVEVGIVADRSAAAASVVDEAGYQWESSGEWGKLGI